MANELTTQAAPRNSKPLSVFSNIDTFADGQRIAKALVSSTLVPEAYRGDDKIGNALIAMDMGGRMNISPIMVMQNLDVIEGRPSWKSSFIIGALNSCGLFSPLRFKIERVGEREASYVTWEGPKGNRQKVTKKAKVNEITCYAYAIEKDTGEILEGPEVSISMAVAEGWYFRPGSKWLTMPDLMIRYRAAAFFGRLYAPHILNGMPTDEEVYDVPEMRDVTPASAEPAPAAAQRAEPEKPASRPRGVHAAMNSGKQSTGEPDKPKPTKKNAPPVIEAEAEEVRESSAQDVDNLQTHDNADDHGGDDDGDMFGAPGDDDGDGYDPA
ncbi:hypothetical protein LCM4579_10480 [Ensifer sp. LCM 4579]|nr:hypothetical protein LCM4579_10480 [Ensifer sp. LCM 4579]